jgi:hypothetical protein
MTFRCSPLTVALVVNALLCPHVGAAQELSADVSTGRLVYDQGATTVATDNVLGTLRYVQHGGWIFGSVAAPLSSNDTFWTAAGTGGRFSVPLGARQVSLGADMDAHAFAFRDRMVDQTGSGGTLEALPFLRLSVGPGYVEGYSGWRGHTITQDALRLNRSIVESGLRAGTGERVRVEAEGRWVKAPEGVFPFVGASVTVGHRGFEAWAQAGRWLDDDLSEPVWGGGVDVRMTARSHLWTSFRQDASDPLYLNTPRKTWSIGITRRLGGAPSAGLPIRSHPAGAVSLRIAAADAAGDELFVGGDFNGWQPVAMRREGDVWVVTLPLAPGTYHYAFRNSRGAWFVPVSTQGRRDDGMGGYVGVLMVS